MAEMVVVRSREEHVAEVRSHGIPMFAGSWFDAAPDHYRGAYDPDRVVVEPDPQFPEHLLRSVVELVVEPPIDEADEIALGTHGSVGGVLDILSSRRGGKSIIILEAAGFQPPDVTAAAALDGLNHIRDWRLSEGVYDPQRVAAIQAVA